MSDDREDVLCTNVSVAWIEVKGRKFKTVCFCDSQASSPHSQHPTVDVSQLQDPHGYSQHSIQVQHIQVTEPSGTGQGSTQVNASYSDFAVLWTLICGTFLLSHYRLLVLPSLLSLSGHRSATKPHLPAAQSGAEPHPANTCYVGSKPHSADRQRPAAGDRTARLHTWELELQGLL